MTWELLSSRRWPTNKSIGRFGITSDPHFEPHSAAKFLVDQHAVKAHNDMLPSEYRVNSLERAYQVQDVIIAEMMTNGREIAGYKVGLTTPRMQAMCGIDQPIGGAVFADVLDKSGASISLSNYGRVGLEFEICVKLGRAIGPEDGPFMRDNIAGYVSDIAPAFELIDDRNADYSNLNIFSLVADNSWNAGVVLGPWSSYSGDLSALQGVLSLNGEKIDEGSGADVLGHPLESLAWMANNLVSRGGGLNAGDLVMTGSLIPTRFPEVGQSYRFTFDALGAVELEIVA